MKRKKHWDQMQWTTETNFAIRHTMTNIISSGINRSIATHCAAAGRYIRMHTRTSCSSVQYSNYNLSGPGALLRNRTRCRRNRKRKTATTHRASAAAPAALLCMYKKNDLSIALTTLQPSSMIVSCIFLDWNEKASSMIVSCTVLDWNKKNSYERKIPITC